MSKPWGTNTIGSWAAEAEREEAEERELGPPTPAASFPSLKEAMSGKSKPKPKKTVMTLNEFNTYGAKQKTFGSGSGSTRLTPDEMLQLPTAPKQRDPEDFSGSRLGGGFSTYGDDRRGGGARRGGFDDDRRGPPPRRDFESQISRADEVDNWAAGKRSIPPPDTGRSSRYGSLGVGSKADDAGNWNFGKKPVSGPPPGRSNTFGSSSRDSVSDWRRGGDTEREESGRQRLVLDPPSRVANELDAGSAVTVVKTEKSNPFGSARPREEVLAEKGLDWKKLESEIEAKKGGGSGSRPTSSHGSRPTSSQSNQSENVGLGVEVAVKPRPKVNPFGDAKPREVLLQEKGMDWRKIDLKLDHRRVNRPETEQERALQEEIENLKKELEKESEGEQTNIRDLVQIKEAELETLVRELDDKVRFGQKAVERPGSGAGRFTGNPERPGSGSGRFTGFSDRPSSQSASFDDVRGPEIVDRPQSRGAGPDAWTRPGEDRRGSFQVGRDNNNNNSRGFLGNRDFDRSRDRW